MPMTEKVWIGTAIYLMAEADKRAVSVRIVGWNNSKACFETVEMLLKSTMTIGCRLERFQIMLTDVPVDDGSRS